MIEIKAERPSREGCPRRDEVLGAGMRWLLTERSAILNTLVAVIGGERLRLFRSKGHKPPLDLIEIDGPAFETLRAGSGGRHRCSTANPDKAHLREVMADPRTFGEIRKHHGPALGAKLVGKIGKDFVKHPEEAIMNAIAAA